MPVKPQLRHLYQSPHWKQLRTVILNRCGHRCEKCGAKAGLKYFSLRTGRLVLVQLGIAHRDHEDLSMFFDETNLWALCRACHLKFDERMHVARARATREARKDSGRPLLGRAA